MGERRLALRRTALACAPDELAYSLRKLMDLYTFEYDVWLRGFQPLLNDPIPAHGHRPLSYQSSQSVGGGPLRGCTELELAIFQHAHQCNNVSTGVLSFAGIEKGSRGREEDVHAAERS